MSTTSDVDREEAGGVKDEQPLTVPDELVREAKETAWHEWMGIAVALIGLLSIMAIIISVVALSSSSKTTTTVQAAAPATSGPAKTAAPAVKPESLSIAVKADDEHGRRGPDGQWHDAFLPADFTVHAGAVVTVTVTNYDGGPHSFTSPSMGVNQTIPGGGSLNAPSRVTFKFTAPKKAGKYQWWCAVPCDPWAMKHDGYMRGFVTVQA
jgi:heme/copper-type cytochrome/quinol oxidase subunit 2